jgi:uncharacterized protein YqfB (UPF0267 family)
MRRTSLKGIDIPIVALTAFNKAEITEEHFQQESMTL